MKKISASVVIVGAGPTGLTLALTLQRYGVPFRIIDKKAGPTTTSNALAIQSRTLELLEDLNLINAFLACGLPVKSFHLNADHQALGSFHFPALPTHYPFMLILPQNKTEELLIQALKTQGVSVEWNVELTALTQTAAEATLQLKTGDQSETLTTNWVLACDGAHSTIRKNLHADFSGTMIPQHFLIADALLNTTLEPNAIHSFLTRDGALLLFPLPSGGHRVLATVDTPDAATVDMTQLAHIIETRSDNAAHLQSVHYQSPFQIHSRHTAQLRQQRIFFLGDAAHIHSPAGGQGMNTGMQDAYNLGFKLALVIQGKAKQTLLDTYHQERHPVLSALVTATKRMTKMLLLRNPILRALRNTAMRYLLKSPRFIKRIGTYISELNIHYTHSAAIEYRSVLSDHSPQPGTRVPEVALTGSYRLIDYLKTPAFVVLIFSGTTQKPDVKLLHDLVSFLKTYGSTLEPILVLAKHIKSELNIENTTVIDDSPAKLHQAFHIDQPAIVVVRPDKYLGYTANGLDGKRLEHYFSESLGIAALKTRT